MNMTTQRKTIQKKIDEVKKQMIESKDMPIMFMYLGYLRGLEWAQRELDKE